MTCCGGGGAGGFVPEGRSAPARAILVRVVGCWFAMASAFPPAGTGASPALPPPLSREAALAALVRIDGVLKDPEVKGRLDAVKAQCVLPDGAPDVMKLMMVGMPVAVESFKGVLADNGFPADQTGLMQFVAAAKAHDGDAEIEALAKAMRDAFLPPELAAMLSMMMGAPPA